jgi:hypothetical protein
MTPRSIGLSALAPLAVALIGCTDSPTPPSKGGSSFMTDGCNVTTGLTIPSGGQPTSQSYLGARVEDGKGGADVDCDVGKEGSGYRIQATAQEGNRSFTVTAMLAQSSEEGQKYSGLGTVYQFDGTQSVNLQSDTDTCSITVLDNQDIANGRVWGNFDCANVHPPRSPGVQCAAHGSFVFENCGD